MKWYQKTWFTWLMLFIFAPLGIVLLWKYRAYSSKTKFAATVIFVFLFLTGLVTDNTDKQIEQTSQQTITTETTSESQNVEPDQIEEAKPEQPIKPEQQEPTQVEQVETTSSSTTSTTPSAPVQQSITYIASSGSNKFHRPKCRAAKKINEENAIYFNSRDEAVSAGYEPCGICKP